MKNEKEWNELISLNSAEIKKQLERLTKIKEEILNKIEFSSEKEIIKAKEKIKQIDKLIDDLKYN